MSDLSIFLHDLSSKKLWSINYAVQDGKSVGMVFRKKYCGKVDGTSDQGHLQKLIQI